jgi:hypothetical protein
MERDEEIGFVPSRNGVTEIRYVGSDQGFHVFTDDRRARVDAAGVQTPAHVDVMALGCSFTWGAGVESADTWVQQLGRTLGVPVANFGMGSYGSVQAFQMLVRNADLRPKVVVYAFMPEHLWRNLSPCAPNYVPFCVPVAHLKREGEWVTLERPHLEYFTPENNRAINREVILRSRWDPLSWLYAAKWAAKIAVYRYPTADRLAVDATPETAAAAIHAMIRAMHDEAADMGARLVVLNLPLMHEGHVDPVAPVLEQALAGKDVTFVDFAPVAAAYFAREPNGSLVLGDDPHPNQLAHRMIAETLAPVVRTLLAETGDGADPG